MIDQLNIFITSIFKVQNVLDNDLRLKLIDFIKSEKIKFHHHEVFRPNAVSSHKGHDNLLELINETLPEFKKPYIEIKKLLKEIASQIGFKDFYIDNSWANIYLPNSLIKRHSHSFAKLSGVIYLKVDEKSNPLYFYNPNPHVIAPNYDHVNSLNFKEFITYPKNSEMLVFPGWLQHGSDVEVNGSEERIVIGFNCL